MQALVFGNSMCLCFPQLRELKEVTPPVIELSVTSSFLHDPSSWLSRCQIDESFQLLQQGSLTSKTFSQKKTVTTQDELGNFYGFEEHTMYMYNIVNYIFLKNQEQFCKILTKPPLPPQMFCFKTLYIPGMVVIGF